MSQTCRWTLVFGDPKAYWRTDCGREAWFSEHRHPQDESYCCYCGGDLAIASPIMTPAKTREVATLESTKDQQP